MIRHILIRPIGASLGGDVMGYGASELVSCYRAADLARLAVGLPVHRGGETHVDLVAFHDRHATAESRGSVGLRRALKREGLAA